MNTRDYKPFVEGGYYHIYNRSNGQQELFLDREDYIFFLFRLKETLYPEKSGNTSSINSLERRRPLPSGAFTLLTYCLMPNHFHFLIQQNTHLEVSKLISKVCTSYSKYFNKKYKRVGSLFQPKFRAISVEYTEYFLWLSAYIHNNPSVAGIISDDKVYPWSSYQDYLGLRNGTLCQRAKILEIFQNSSALYEKYVLSCQPLIVNKKHLSTLRIDD